MDLFHPVCLWPTGFFYANSIGELVSELGRALRSGLSECQDWMLRMNANSWYRMSNRQEPKRLSKCVSFWVVAQDFPKFVGELKEQANYRRWVHAEGVPCFLSPRKSGTYQKRSKPVSEGDFIKKSVRPINRRREAINTTPSNGANRWNEKQQRIKKTSLHPQI